jgi:hypothetical protein
MGKRIALNGRYEDGNGGWEWFKDDLRHREDGPAIEEKNGTKYFYQNDLQHRENGPAVEYSNGDKMWYFKGIWVGNGDSPDPVLWERLTSHEKNGGPLLNGHIEDLEGNQYWYKDDHLHREDGPAVVTDIGEEYYLNGEHLGWEEDGFWNLWKKLSKEQRKNPNLLKYKEEYEE